MKRAPRAKVARHVAPRVLAGRAGDAARAAGAAGGRLLCEGELMPTTFQKRQKEMKRIEKRKMKEEKRAQRKIDKDVTKDAPYDPASDPTIDWNHSNEINSQE